MTVRLILRGWGCYQKKTSWVEYDMSKVRNHRVQSNVFVSAAIFFCGQGYSEYILAGLGQKNKKVEGRS